MTTNLVKFFGIYLSDIGTLYPSQCPIGWDPAKSLEPGVIVRGSQMVVNLVKWLQDGHAYLGVTWIKEEVTPLTDAQAKGNI